MSSPADFRVAFCGGGPAAIGPILAAARRGRLDELLSGGVLLVEPARIGPGGAAGYRVPANSPSGSFLDCLDELDGPFSRLRNAPEAVELRRWGSDHPPMGVVAAFLDLLGETVARLLREHPDCRVLQGWSVDELRLLPSGVLLSAGYKRATVSRAVIAMGGRPFAGFDRTTLLPGLTLAPYRGTVCHAEALLDSRREEPQRLVAGIRETGRATIVGGGHSAWAVAGLILADARFHRDGVVPELTILHRGTIRLHYSSTKDAQADGHAYDPALDVCPLSGEVNRYGGLRGAARELARSALGLADPMAPIRLVRLDSTSSSRSKAMRALDAAGAIVVATGYQANLPRLLRADGTELTAAVSPAGTVVTPRAHLVDTTGRAHPQLLTYGLGAAIDSSAGVDGVRPYQHETGNIVLNELLPVSTGYPAIMD